MYQSSYGEYSSILLLRDHLEIEWLHFTCLSSLFTHVRGFNVQPCDDRYLDPIYFGDYPVTMREKLGDCLPKFSESEKELLKNSVDFVGLNHYTTRFICHSTKNLEQEAERIGKSKLLFMFAILFLRSISSLVRDAFPSLLCCS